MYNYIYIYIYMHFSGLVTKLLLPSNAFNLLYTNSRTEHTNMTVVVYSVLFMCNTLVLL